MRLASCAHARRLNRMGGCGSAAHRARPLAKPLTAKAVGPWNAESCCGRYGIAISVLCGTGAFPRFVDAREDDQGRLLFALARYTGPACHRRVACSLGQISTARPDAARPSADDTATGSVPDALLAKPARENAHRTRANPLDFAPAGSEGDRNRDSGAKKKPARSLATRCGRSSSGGGGI